MSGSSNLIAWCDAAAAPWALKRWHVEPTAAVLRLHVADADGRLFAGAAAFARLWRELPGYRWFGLLLALPGVTPLAERIYDAAYVRPLRRRLSCESVCVGAPSASHQTGRAMRSAAASTDRFEPAPQASPAGGTVAADPTFRRLLGEAAWRRLDANIRARFAVKPSVDEVITFVGEMAVVRRSWYGWILAHACRLIGAPLAPRRGRNVPTVVRIYRSGRCDGVVWERRYAFAGRRRPVVVASDEDDLAHAIAVASLSRHCVGNCGASRAPGVALRAPPPPSAGSTSES